MVVDCASQPSATATPRTIDVPRGASAAHTSRSALNASPKDGQVVELQISSWLYPKETHGGGIRTDTEGASGAGTGAKGNIGTNDKRRGAKLGGCVEFDLVV